MTAACKIIYCVMLSPMLIITLNFFSEKDCWRFWLYRRYVGLLFFIFFLRFNPTLWYTPDAGERKNERYLIHEHFRQKPEYYPFLAAIAWVTRSVAHQSGRYFEKSTPTLQQHSRNNFLFSCDD
jgi:hypothetical protein